MYIITRKLYSNSSKESYVAPVIIQNPPQKKEPSTLFNLKLKISPDSIAKDIKICTLNESYYHGEIQQARRGPRGRIEQENVTENAIGVKDFRVCSPGTVEGIRTEVYTVSLF